ncbi:MAG: hypothetical protein MPK62_03105 [Alphaproteobacteria bacterium]|nr:hypothetical protein [Alphaproteobacteria bacterium]MDA8030118.1 hypothetical protein [Alphaproteobacteria bacterium]
MGRGDPPNGSGSGHTKNPSKSFDKNIKSVENRAGAGGGQELKVWKLIVIFDKEGKAEYDRICKEGMDSRLELVGRSVDGRPDGAWKKETEAMINGVHAVAVIISWGIGDNEGAKWTVEQAHDIKLPVIGIRMVGIKPTNVLDTHKTTEWNPAKIIEIIGR